jgi:hypothetical protein
MNIMLIMVHSGGGQMKSSPLNPNYGLLAVLGWLVFPAVPSVAQTVITQLPYTINSSGRYEVQNNLIFTANAQSPPN